MTQQEERIEAMSQILDDLKVKLSEEQVKELAEAFTLHLEMEREMENYQFVGRKSECTECTKKSTEISDLKRQVNVYHKNVCIRRKTDDVWIEGETVMFRK